MSGLSITGFDTSSFDGSQDTQSFDGASLDSLVVATPTNVGDIVTATLNGQSIDLTHNVDIPVGSSTLTINVTEQ